MYWFSPDKLISSIGGSDETSTEVLDAETSKSRDVELEVEEFS